MFEDNRFVSQKSRMLSLKGSNPDLELYYIFEGDPEDHYANFQLNNMRPSQVRQVMIDTANEGFNVQKTSHLKETVNFLAAFSRDLSQLQKEGKLAEKSNTLHYSLLNSDPDQDEVGIIELSRPLDFSGMVPNGIFSPTKNNTATPYNNPVSPTSIHQIPRKRKAEEISPKSITFINCDSDEVQIMFETPNKRRHLEVSKVDLAQPQVSSLVPVSTPAIMGSPMQISSPAPPQRTQNILTIPQSAPHPKILCPICNIELKGSEQQNSIHVNEHF